MKPPRRTRPARVGIRYKTAGPSECPVCGTPYTAFRTGLSFSAVQQMLFTPSEDRTRWRQKRRGGVLGFWWELKQQLWAYHVEACDDRVPF